MVLETDVVSGLSIVLSNCPLPDLLATSEELPEDPLQEPTVKLLPPVSSSFLPAGPETPLVSF